MKEIVLSDGLIALREELKLAEVMRLIERTARWVDPETFRLLPVWYPEYARRSLFYKNNWSEPQMNKNRETGQVEHKREANSYANKALTRALGLRSSDRPNWSCCHIWGVDDHLFQSTNAIVQDHRFYSCVANMILLPTPLKAFTDAMPDVKAMLRNLPGEMQTTITLKKVSVGTEIAIVQERIPAMIPTEACCLGWQESLTLLAQLAQPDIPG